MKREALFKLTEKVIIDGCKSISCVIISIIHKIDGITYEVSYWDDGRMITPSPVDEWRLSKWEE